MEEAAGLVMTALYERGMLRTWYRDRPEGWTLVSGQWSPIYLQLRELCSHPDVLTDVGVALAALLDKDQPRPQRLVGVALGGIPVAIATSLASGVPALMTRKLAARTKAGAAEELQQYGQHAAVEGRIEAGDQLLLVDDLVTRFDSKLIAARQVQHEIDRRGLEGVSCSDVLVVVDREQGGADAALEAGFTLRSLIRLKSQGMDLLRPHLSATEYDVVCSYLSDPAAFQSVDVQRQLRVVAEAG
ncbi:MAG: hypothetical protein WAV54_13250 [Acidimicrobiales bacterium]